MARAAPARNWIVALMLLAPASVWAQGETVFEQQRALWTVEVGAGARAPTTLYNEFIVRRESADSVLRTRWEENADMGWETRVGMRYNPEGGVGLFFGGFLGGASTTASFSGGLEAPERIRRSVGYSGLDFGLTMRLGHWSQGRGVLSYHLGGVVQRAVIDLSPGHRDALAYFRDAPQHEIDWDSRTSTSWGLNLGVTLRSPISERWSFRATFKDLILPTNTTSLAEQEMEDIEALSGRDVRVSLNRYTSHNLSLTVGVEYTLGWGQPRRDVIRRAPQPDAPPELDPAVRNATRLAAAGDTAAAVAALEHRVSVEPRDAFAWRELALLRAPRAEDDPTVRPEALVTLERALNMNPGDTELLRAYGRLRGLTERAGRTPEAEAVSRIELSSLSVSTGSDGAVRVAFAARGLSAAVDGQHRYESAIAVFAEDGSSVPIRAGLAPLHEGAGDELVMLGAAAQLPLSLSLDFFLAQPDPGFYTVRVRLTDLETGARQEATEGFELP
jgi:hypothetical protein